MTHRTDKPVPGKVYALTGADRPSIARGDTWAASEVKAPPTGTALALIGTQITHSREEQAYRERQRVDQVDQVDQLRLDLEALAGLCASATEMLSARGRLFPVDPAALSTVDLCADAVLKATRRVTEVRRLQSAIGSYANGTEMLQGLRDEILLTGTEGSAS